jgi:hypothetical protein
MNPAKPKLIDVAVVFAGGMSTAFGPASFDVEFVLESPKGIVRGRASLVREDGRGGWRERAPETQQVWLSGPEMTTLGRWGRPLVTAALDAIEVAALEEIDQARERERLETLAEAS